MAKIICVNRFFHPDQSATSQILTDLALVLARDGHDVRVIASHDIITGPSEELIACEKFAGVAIYRVGSKASTSASLLARFLTFLSFYWWAAFQLRSLATRNCIVIVKSDPPLLSVWASWLLATRQVRIVNWLQDVYPEVAIRFDVRFLRGLLGTVLMKLRDRSIRSAAVNVVIGDRMANYLANRNISRMTMRVIPNWIDDEVVRPVEPSVNPLRDEWGLADKFVFGYSGNLGRVHEFGTLLAAAEHFKGRSDLCLLFIGGGFQYSQLEQELAARGLEELALFKPYQDQSGLAYSLSVPDVHWLSLRPEYEGLIVPSKFYGIASAGRGAVAITDRDGEIARLVDKHKCGAVIAPGDSRGLVNLLESMIENRDLGEQWGRNARKMIETEFSRRQALRKWRDLVGSLDGGSNQGAQNS